MKTPDFVDASAPGGVAQAVLQAFRQANESATAEGSASKLLASWVDSPNSVSVIYQIPSWPSLLGIRRQFPPHFYDDDPASTGMSIQLDMDEPLGTNASSRGRVDKNGITWFGNVAEVLPEVRVDWLEGQDVVSHPLDRP